MLKAAFLPVVVFGLCGVGLCGTVAPQASDQPATSPTVVEELSLLEPYCYFSRYCQRDLLLYEFAIRSMDFAQLAKDIDNICDTLVPSAIQCRVNSSTDLRCYAEHEQFLSLYLKFCSEKQDLKAGLECWSNGFQLAAQQCRRKAQKDRSELGNCQAVAKSAFCISKKLRKIPKCSENDIKYLMKSLEKQQNYACETHTFSL